MHTEEGDIVRYPIFDITVSLASFDNGNSSCNSEDPGFSTRVGKS